jgi:hypothetical protein
LTLLVSSGLALGNAPVNLPLLWRAGTPMKDAIVNSLKIGFPGYTVSCNISPNLVLQNDEVGFYENVTQFAQWARNLSLDIVKTEGYTGVEIVVQQSNFVVFDGTSPVMPKAIAPTDLVGQPSWFAPNSISAALVMRGDLNINDYITFPKVQFTTQASALTQYASKSIFQGVFQIYKIRHTGNSRQPSGTSWTSTIECVQLPGGGSK